jgi:hypothetical protein
MARTVKNLQEAVAALRRDPAQPVRARVDDLEVELRAVRGGAKVVGLGDRIAALGPWEGESPEEIRRILREARQAGGSAEPPAL